jgi:ATP-dependent 26S proteasome regulatory subunit
MNSKKTDSKQAAVSPELLDALGGGNMVLTMLADQTIPFQHRVALLRQVVQDGTPHAEPVIKALLAGIGKHAAQAVYEDKVKKLEAILNEMQNGPMRSATFIEMLPKDGQGLEIALVLLDDGTEAYTVLPKEEATPPLRRGDRVVVDARGRVLLRRSASSLRTGEIGRLERRLDDYQIEISLRSGSERGVYLATQILADQIRTGQVAPGASIIVSVRQSLALAAVPAENGLSHFRFLDRRPVPDVLVERDIGAPPRCIEEVTRHIRLELMQPELRRRYGLRRSLTKLLCGVSGTGKTLAVSAIHRRMYEVMSEVTGIPIAELPPRVFRIRQSEVLSMWLGESEKNWQRAIDEALQLAAEPFTTPDGRQLQMPVLIVLEEIDGMGRVRGQEAIADRILNTTLIALDASHLESEGPVVVLATTNEPHLVDPALLRRVGGSIEYFNRLKRNSFVAVLRKLTTKLPVASLNGCAPGETWENHIQNLAAWLFNPNGSDPGLVELTYAGSTSAVIKRARDFLTPALVDRAVQQAATEAADAEVEGGGSGITLEQLARAFESQIRGIVDQLNERNVGSYTTLPDGVRVATLRRLSRPEHLSFEFRRN